MRTLRLLAVVASSVLACDTFEATPASLDGGGDGGTGGDAASGCATVYVSAESGLDGNTGCSPAQAKRTITSALAAAKQRKGEVQEVHVCKGDYGEADLVLDQRVSLRGGYACGDFAREANFGAASDWKFANPTTVYNAKPGPGSAALTVTGTDVGNSIEIDGFVLRSAVQSATLALALGVDAASPFVHDCVLRAEGTVGGGGVVGARLTGTSARFAKDKIEVVGGGTEETAGMGLVASGGGTVTVEYSSIKVSGGRGKLSGSVGLYVAGVTLKATANFVVASGEPATMTGEYTQSAGFTVVNAPGSTLRGNNVVAIGGGCTTSPKCSVSGVGIAGSPRVEVTGNRVMAAATPNAGTNTLMAMSLLASDASLVANNALLNDASHSTAALASRFGLSVQASSNVSAIGNTVVFSRGSGRTDPFNEVNIGVALFGVDTPTTPQSSAFVFHRNLVAMLDEDVNAPQRADLGVLATTCPLNGFGPPPQNNVILGFSGGAAPTRARYATTSGCSLQSSITTFTNSLPGDDPGSARYTCPGGPTPAKCVEGLFLPLSRSDWAATLMEDKLKLAPTAPCVLAKGGGSVASDVGFDLLGKPRANPFTPGAYERDACVPPDP